MRLRNCFNICLVLVAFVMVFGVVRQANAVPILIGIGDFSGSETVIDFDSLPMNGTAVTTQFNGDGVDFLTTGGGWVTSSERIYSAGADPLNGIVRTTVNSANVFIDFLSPVNRVGFELGSNINLTVTIQTLLSGLPTGSFVFNQSHTTIAPSPVFHGFEDTAGIDGLSFTFSSGVHYINDLRFETSGAAPIPEPATVALLGIGLVGLTGASVRRRRKKIADC